MIETEKKDLHPEDPDPRIDGWYTTDEVQVGSAAVIPEFSVVTLGLGLIAVLAGLIVIRKRRQ